MIIGISGKIGSGKDTVGKIIQYLSSKENATFQAWSIAQHNCKSKTLNECYQGGWRIVKFADALKDIVCILTGCTREQLEDSDFKNSKLSDEWIRYGYADGFIKKYIGNGEMGEPIMNNKQCSKEKYEEELRTNWQTTYKSHLTYRKLLQYIGTNLLRNQLNENVWVNALFSKYKPTYNLKHSITVDTAPNWIITDVRFPNEADAIKDRGGIVIRVNRLEDWEKELTIKLKKELSDGMYVVSDNPIMTTGKGGKILYEIEKERHCRQLEKHSSETALDDYDFDYVVNNDFDIQSLIEKIKIILVNENIL